MIDDIGHVLAHGKTGNECAVSAKAFAVLPVHRMPERDGM